MQGSPKVLGITLARGGSKSIPKKNIKTILGKPLIAYTIIEALKSKLISKYIVSTDDEEIKNISLKYGADVPFMRPQKLATDLATSSDAIKHAVRYMQQKDSIKYDYIIELMCTNPLKTANDIDECLLKLIKTDADSVIAMHKIEDNHPIRVKKIVNDKIVDFCLPEIPETRRQDLKPDAYIRSGSIYALKREQIMKYNKRYGTIDSRPYILPNERAVNIDNKIDFLMAESLLKER